MWRARYADRLRSVMFRAWTQTSKMHDIARRVVAAEIHKFDRRLGDPRLADRLSRACAEGAADRWATLTRHYC